MIGNIYLNNCVQFIVIVYSISSKCEASYSPFSIFSSHFFGKQKDMNIIYGWKTIDFVFTSSSSRLAMMRSGHFIPGNSLILDADFWENGEEEKLFVTLPRLKEGIPATLATVSPLLSYDGSPKLQPYPDWSWQRQTNCEGIVSAFRTKIDQCGRLWVIDAGVTNILHSFEKVCSPKLMVFDLLTDQLVIKYVFPKNVLESSSLLVTVVVDDRSRHCRDSFAYVADITGYGLIVFDSKSRHSWRIRSNYFYPYPLHGTFKISGLEFDLMDGVIGLALSSVNKFGDRTLYFHSLASVRESKVSATFLRNESYFFHGENKVSKKFYITDEVKTSQSAAQDMSENDILFFGLLSSNSIACWNTRLPYLNFNLETIAQNNETLQFSSGIKVVKKNGRQELLVTTSKFPNYFLDKINHNEINFRILSQSVDNLVHGTLCDSRSYYRLSDSYNNLEINSWK